MESQLMRRLIVSMIAALVAVSLVPIASAQEEDDQVTLRVGLTQDWEVLNPTSGYTVAAYEVWNLHYATLTDKAADDFATIPGLAESWEEVEPGREYVYTLREGLTWSDGEPLTAEDVAWNINTSRDQGWDNMVSTVANIEATAEDERTVRLVSSVPDPKLPTMDVYLVPQHIWEPIATDYDAATQYAADDGVGSGPFVMTEFTPGQSVVMEVNPSYWGWEGEEPPYDQVIFRLFENPDAMVAALQQGEIDAAQGVPASSWDALEADDAIEVVAGQQGGFDQIAINGGAAEGQPHPALLDIEVRRAIAHAIDRPAVIEDLYFGLASPLETISPSADPKWMPEIPEDDRFDYDPALANQILDDAGYLDSDGDGVREMPDGTNPLVIRHAVNTDGDLAGSIGDLMVGWMEEIGIDVTLESYAADALFGVLVDGTYDTFYWGWVPFVDPDPMLSYFTEAEIGNYNDANWFDPAYDALYTEQNQEVDPDRRVEIVHEMLTIFHDAAVYIPMYIAPDLQAYRTDTFEGWVRQPAEIGPVIYNNTSPSYVQLTPIGANAGASDINWLLWGGIAAGVILIAGVFLAMRNRSTADERE
jgi:peptide/nickel transport system substrate-binding protein